MTKLSTLETEKQRKTEMVLGILEERDRCWYHWITQELEMEEQEKSEIPISKVNDTQCWGIIIHSTSFY